MNTYELVIPALATNARSVALLELALKLNQEARDLLNAEMQRAVTECRQELDYKNQLQPPSQKSRMQPKLVVVAGAKGTTSYVYWAWSKPIKREVFKEGRFVPIQNQIKKGAEPRYTTVSLAKHMIGWELPIIEQWENVFAAMRVQGDCLSAAKRALEDAVKNLGNPPNFEKETGKFQGPFGKRKGRFVAGEAEAMAPHPG